MKHSLLQSSLVAILGVAVVGSAIAVSRPDYTFFDPLVDIKAIISRQYVDEPDEEAMQLGAINGMLEALNDPYTMFVPPEQTREFTKELTGDFVGIGVQVLVRDGWLTVVNLLEDTPAFRAGIMPEDRIVEIEGESTFGLTGDQCVERLTGEPGTKVKIVVERDGQKIPLTITRARIIARTVKGIHWESRPGEAEGAGRWQFFVDPARKIAYLRLTQFSPTSAEEVQKALTAMGAAKGEVGGLVIDLRWNGGGVLSDAVAIADLFLNEGLIVSTRGRAHAEESFRARTEGTLPPFPVAVLINGQSASASEVLAGALVESGRAVTVGTRTFGKGLVQSILNLPSGKGQLKLTEQRYYLPSGRTIHRTDDSTEWGVDPTPGFYVPLSDEELAALVSKRREEETIGAGRNARAEEQWSNPEWIVEHLKDKQMAAALRAVQLRIDTGEWKPTGESAAPGQAATLEEMTRLEGIRERLLRELTRVDRRLDALESAAGQEATSPKDLWADTIDLTGGTLEVRDKAGKVVATLQITGNNLERWLLDADVKKADGP